MYCCDLLCLCGFVGFYLIVGLFGSGLVCLMLFVALVDFVGYCLYLLFACC